jgi:rhodanese-related sulfurtransferase
MSLENKPVNRWARHFRQAFAEAGVILVAAMVLGIGNTALHKQGLFRESPANPPLSESMSTFISLEEARSLFESSQALFIDARHEYDYNLAHIEGAVNLPIQSLDANPGLLVSLPRDKTLVAYCDGQECNSSVRLAEKLIEAGYTDVKIFLDGWNAWKSDSSRIEVSAR